MAETATGHSVFVARQPILDGEQKTYAYELLFRSGLENRCNFTDGDSATLDVIANTFLEIGLDELTAGKPCFINFTRKLLLRNVPQLLPPDLVVVEILEDIEPDKAPCGPAAGSATPGTRSHWTTSSSPTAAARSST